MFAGSPGLRVIVDLLIFLAAMVAGGVIGYLLIKSRQLQARNEAEAAQLVIRPAAGLKGLTISAGALAGTGGAAIPKENIEILKVQYVNVTTPTDKSSTAGLWPDPLPPLKAPIDLEAGKTQPWREGRDLGHPLHERHFIARAGQQEAVGICLALFEVARAVDPDVPELGSNRRFTPEFEVPIDEAAR